MLIENKNTSIVVILAFLLTVWLTYISMIAAFGVPRLIAGTGRRFDGFEGNSLANWIIAAERFNLGGSRWISGLLLEEL